MMKTPAKLKSAFKGIIMAGMNTETAPQANWMRTIVIGRKPERTLVRVVILVITCFFIARFVLLPIRVQGGSMVPTYKDNGVNFVNRLAYVFSEPKRGDVVAIRLAGPSIMYLKRIVGLPGETVGFHEGHVVINGQVLDEPYLRFQSDWEDPPRRLGPDEYYCVGDNRSMPQDDHTEGKAKRERIMGKILL